MLAVVGDSYPIYLESDDIVISPGFAVRFPFENIFFGSLLTLTEKKQPGKGHQSRHPTTLVLLHLLIALQSFSTLVTSSQIFLRSKSSPMTIKFCCSYIMEES